MTGTGLLNPVDPYREDRRHINNWDIHEIQMAMSLARETFHISSTAKARKSAMSVIENCLEDLQLRTTRKVVVE